MNIQNSSRNNEKFSAYTKPGYSSNNNQTIENNSVSHLSKSIYSESRPIFEKGVTLKIKEKKRKISDEVLPESGDILMEM